MAVGEHDPAVTARAAQLNEGKQPRRHIFWRKRLNQVIVCAAFEGAQVRVAGLAENEQRARDHFVAPGRHIVGTGCAPAKIGHHRPFQLLRCRPPRLGHDIEAGAPKASLNAEQPLLSMPTSVARITASVAAASIARHVATHLLISLIQTHALSRSEHIQLTSEIGASPQVVWDRATSMEGIRDEMWPWLRMTIPRGLDAVSFAQRLSDGRAELPASLGRSWILLFRVLPVDWDDIVLNEIEPGRRFVEQSTMASMQSWRHERIVSAHADPQRSTVKDRVTFVPRRLVPRVLARTIVQALFRHRHARLIQHHGG